MSSSLTWHHNIKCHRLEVSVNSFVNIAMSPTLAVPLNCSADYKHNVNTMLHVLSRVHRGVLLALTRYSDACDGETSVI